MDESNYPALTITSEGPRVLLPADAAGDREILTIRQAHARATLLLCDEDCRGPLCLGCKINDLLIGIR